MKHLPNILSSLRIVGTVVLLLSDVSSIFFGESGETGTLIHAKELYQLSCP